MPNLDLDAFLKEQNEDPYTVTLGGKTFTVPSDLPAFALQRHAGLREKDITPETVSELLSLIFGKSQYEEMQKAGLTPGGVAEMKVFAGVSQHIAKNMVGEEALGKLMDQAMASATSQTNGTKKPGKAKAKRSR